MAKVLQKYHIMANEGSIRMLRFLRKLSKIRLCYCTIYTPNKFKSIFWIDDSLIRLLFKIHTLTRKNRPDNFVPIITGNNITYTRTQLFVMRHFNIPKN